MKYLAIVQYEGTNYQGWQVQPDQVTIQEIIEQKISMILNTPIKIYGSGRTDSGVHAKGQTFHFEWDELKDIAKFKYSLNCVLPEDIFVKSLTPVADDFHARFSVVEKTYQYLINTGDYDVFNRHLVYQFNKNLDVEKMKDVASIFVGKHCFKNFTTKPEDEDGFVRTITNIEIKEENHQISLTFTGDGFMRYMVRFLVGTLIEVGLGKLTKNDVQKYLDLTERKTVSYKADSCGLYLMNVKY